MQLINLGLLDRIPFWRNGVAFAKRYSYLASCASGIVTSGWAYRTSQNTLNRGHEQGRKALLNAYKIKRYSAFYVGSSLVGAMLAMNVLRGNRFPRWAVEVGDALSYGSFGVGAYLRYQVERQRWNACKGNQEMAWQQQLADIGCITAIMEMANCGTILVFGASPLTFSLSVMAPTISTGAMLATTVREKWCAPN